MTDKPTSDVVFKAYNITEAMECSFYIDGVRMGGICRASYENWYGVYFCELLPLITEVQLKQIHDMLAKYNTIQR